MSANINCELSNWGLWGDCVGLPCETGVRERTRTIVTQPTNGGAQCGPLIEFEPCPAPCPTPGPSPTPAPTPSPSGVPTCNAKLNGAPFYSSATENVLGLAGSFLKMVLWGAISIPFLIISLIMLASKKARKSVGGIITYVITVLFIGAAILNYVRVRSYTKKLGEEAANGRPCVDEDGVLHTTPLST